MKNLEAVIKERMEYKRIKEEAEAKMKELDAVIKTAMNGQQKLVVGPYKVALTEQNRTTIAAKEFQSQYPELYCQFARPSSYVTLRIS